MLKPWDGCFKLSESEVRLDELNGVRLPHGHVSLGTFEPMISQLPLEQWLCLDTWHLREDEVIFFGFL